MVKELIKKYNETEFSFNYFRNDNIINFSQQIANQIYNWDDPSIVGSTAYDNAYNECWGVTINNHEIAIIGSTEEHIFDITNTSNISEVAFVEGAYTGPELLSRL